ncbi:hypothetical protein BB558_001123 [Smittium angustum]|uniref:Uncharacterized protein n=1 Tax=Smittium angustum TaxID=133377 RepID=A0A2U1JCP3_SMIAN|nr:hypothetical protein BB558_001123 [Smittium angustum]
MPTGEINGSGQQTSEPFQPVWELRCKHCTALWSSRGMEAMVMARPAIRCFSTDLPPLSCDVIHPNIPDSYHSIVEEVSHPSQKALTHHARRFDLVPSGPCDCYVQDIACLGCGNIVGYYIHRPCFRCLAQRLRIKQRGYQHLWTFYQENVEPTLRRTFHGSPVSWEELSQPYGKNAFVHVNNSVGNPETRNNPIGVLQQVEPRRSVSDRFGEIVIESRNVSGSTNNMFQSRSISTQSSLQTENFSTSSQRNLSNQSENSENSFSQFLARISQRSRTRLDSLQNDNPANTHQRSFTNTTLVTDNFNSIPSINQIQYSTSELRARSVSNPTQNTLLTNSFGLRQFPLQDNVPSNPSQTSISQQPSRYDGSDIPTTNTLNPNEIVHAENSIRFPLIIDDDPPTETEEVPDTCLVEETLRSAQISVESTQNLSSEEDERNYQIYQRRLDRYMGNRTLENERESQSLTNRTNSQNHSGTLGEQLHQEQNITRRYNETNNNSDFEDMDNGDTTFDVETIARLSRPNTENTEFEYQRHSSTIQEQNSLSQTENNINEPQHDFPRNGPYRTDSPQQDISRLRSTAMRVLLSPRSAADSRIEAASFLQTLRSVAAITRRRQSRYQRRLHGFLHQAVSNRQNEHQETLQTDTTTPQSSRNSRNSETIHTLGLERTRQNSGETTPETATVHRPLYQESEAIRIATLDRESNARNTFPRTNSPPAPNRFVARPRQRRNAISQYNYNQVISDYNEYARNSNNPRSTNTGNRSGDNDQKHANLLKYKYSGVPPPILTWLLQSGIESMSNWELMTVFR